MMGKLLFITLTAMLLTACNYQDEDQSTGKGMNTETENVNFENVNENNIPEGFYERDISQDTDDDERNAGTNFVDPTQTRNDLGDDQNKLRDIVEENDAFDPGMIYVLGRTIRVNVTPTQNFSQEELQERVTELEKDMIRAMPRYEIKINVN